MHILLATPTVLVGDGQSRVNYELAAYLTTRGHRVTLLAGNVAAELQSREGVDWQRLQARSGLPALPRETLWSHQATRWLSEHRHRFDILHLNGASAFLPHDVNTCHFVHTTFRKYLRQEPRPGLRGRYHRLYSDVNARAERRAYSHASRVVAVSRKTASELEDAVGVPPERVEVVYNGVDGDLFRPDPAVRARVRGRLAITEETFALFFVGDLVVPRKGLRTVLEALDGLPENVRLYVAGDGSPEPYASMLDRLGGRVQLLGFRPDMPELYAAMDCFTYPTRYDACCLAVLEALASGIPVITTLESGSGELIDAGASGLVLDGPDDVAGLRRSIMTLLGDRRFAGELGKRGRLVAEAHAWQTMAQRYEQIYRALLEAREASR